MSKPLYCPWIVYLPLNARSECVAPNDFPVGGVVDTMFMFHAAWPASHHPALRPTRGSGDGAMPDTIGVTGRGITEGGVGGGGGGVPRPPRPAAAGCPLPASGCPPAGGCAAGCAGAAAEGCAAGGCAGCAAGCAGAGVAAGVAAGFAGAAAGGLVVVDELPHAAANN